MSDIADLLRQRLNALELTAIGAPIPASNPFFGVGPITDALKDDVDSRLRRLAFDAWIEKTYRKFDDKGNDLGGFTTAEISRSMHRGYPADAILVDMMRSIHRYFGFPKTNRMAVGLGGGHSGFTVCVMHLMNANDTQQTVYVDTLKPESSGASTAGFFRQSWATQLIEMQRFATNGDENRIHFAIREGHIPTASELEVMGVSLFIGVGHETTGANAYTQAEITELLKWLDGDPAGRHAVFDATSMLGAMPWEPELVREVMAKCCLFMPFQKAIGGISGYYVAAFTPQALELVEHNQQNPPWAIPRQLKLAPPVNAQQPLSAKRSVDVGPFFDATCDKMIGGMINTYSALAFAETTFNLLQAEAKIGPVEALNRRSAHNRSVINAWVMSQNLLSLVVEDPERRGAAVTLLKVEDADITDPAIHARIIARSKQLLGYEGFTHPNGDYESGLDTARYINAFPGMPGDYRAWVGGIREPEDVVALLNNLHYAYLRAKIVVLEEELDKAGITFESTNVSDTLINCLDTEKAYKVLIVDHLGLKLQANGQPDSREIEAYIKEKGGLFHRGAITDTGHLQQGLVHFFYQPDLSAAEDILRQSDQGQYDALIAAATMIPENAKFEFGGVRIGAGTGNMRSLSWGGVNGEGGNAPLMNTPGINSRVTAQMVLKAILKVAPELPVQILHDRVVKGDFDTGRDLKDYPSCKLEGLKFTIFGNGNIGGEVARLAKAFGMQVVIYARPRHQEQIEALGYAFCANPVEAARGADFLSVHTGLGRFNATTGIYSNAGLVNAEIFNALNNGAVVVNYDRGEIIEITALSDALDSGKVRHAAIDADLFKNLETGDLSGPMLPYLALAERHDDKLELLPHAAADTDHPSRVMGAKQAVDQIFSALCFKRIINLVGELPKNYLRGAIQKPAGIGRVSVQNILALSQQQIKLTKLREVSEKIAAILGALESAKQNSRFAALSESHASDLMLQINKQKLLLEELGLCGAFGE